MMANKKQYFKTRLMLYCVLSSVNCICVLLTYCAAYRYAVFVANCKHTHKTVLRSVCLQVVLCLQYICILRPMIPQRGVSMCLSRVCAVQKRLNGSRFCSGWKVLGTQATLYQMESDPPTVRRRGNKKKCGYCEVYDFPAYSPEGATRACYSMQLSPNCFDFTWCEFDYLHVYQCNTSEKPPTLLTLFKVIDQSIKTSQRNRLLGFNGTAGRRGNTQVNNHEQCMAKSPDKPGLK